MKYFLMRCSAGLLLTFTGFLNLPVVSQPAAAQPSNSNQVLNSPLLRGVTLTPQQQAQLVKIRNETDQQVSKLLTAEQKKVAATQGTKAVKLSSAQQTKYLQIAKNSSARVQALFTPTQLQQIKANIQAMQSTNGQR